MVAFDPDVPPMKRIRSTTAIVHTGDADQFLVNVSAFAHVVRITELPNNRVGIHLNIKREEWHQALELINKYDPRPDRLWREECRFSAKEMSEAELLVLMFARSPSPVAEVANYDYDLPMLPESPPPWCWQSSVLKMHKSNMPKPSQVLAETTGREVLVHLESIGLLKLDQEKHLKFIGIDDMDGDGWLDWKQLAASILMPQYHVANSGVELSECQPTGPLQGISVVYDSYTNGFLPVYSRSAIIASFGRLPNCAFTSELYGKWSSDPRSLQSTPQPRVIVSQQMRNRLLTYGAKRFRFIPIKLLE